MTQPEENLRIRRTRKLLREALIDLIEEQGFESLTVGEITGRAMVSRAAFYRNYQDKYDLVEQVFNEAMGSLFEAVSEPDTAHSPQIWIRFFEHIAEYERLYHALLGRKGSPWFVLKMRASINELIQKYWQLARLHPEFPQPLYPTTDDFVPDILSTMFVETIAWWLEHGRPYPPEAIAHRSISLAMAFFKETMTWDKGDLFDIAGKRG